MGRQNLLAISFLALAGLGQGSGSSLAQERHTDMKAQTSYVQTEEDVARKLGGAQFSPYAGRSYPTRPLWGDQHLHTEISVDAGTMCRLGQEDAYRFARGEEVTSTTGVRAKLSRPLDWLVISDHAEMYGLMPQLLSGDRDLLATEQGKSWYKALKSGDKEKMFATAMEIVAALSKPEPPFKSDKIVRKAWEKYTALADKYNEPGRFSAIIGYEYTTRGGYNLHQSQTNCLLEPAGQFR